MLVPLLRGLGELLAPKLCPGCDLPNPGEESAFCPACRPLLELAPQVLLPPQPAAAAFLFQGPLADAVRRFKYQGRAELGGGLGRLLGEACASYAGRVERVVPMPLHPRKLQSRGYNPAALLGRELAATLDARLDCAVLRRVRDTPPQAGLARAARAGNVSGAFAASQATSNARVLLVDDVRTTGATSSEAARALLEAGHQVFSVALAWSPA